MGHDGEGLDHRHVVRGLLRNQSTFGKLVKFRKAVTLAEAFLGALDGGVETTRAAVVRRERKVPRTVALVEFAEESRRRIGRLLDRAPFVDRAVDHEAEVRSGGGHELEQADCTLVRRRLRSKRALDRRYPYEILRKADLGHGALDRVAETGPSFEALEERPTALLLGGEVGDVLHRSLGHRHLEIGQGGHDPSETEFLLPVQIDEIEVVEVGRGNRRQLVDGFAVRARRRGEHSQPGRLGWRRAPPQPERDRRGARKPDEGREHPPSRGLLGGFHGDEERPNLSRAGYPCKRVNRSGNVKSSLWCVRPRSTSEPAPPDAGRVACAGRDDG